MSDLPAHVKRSRDRDAALYERAGIERQTTTVLGHEWEYCQDGDVIHAYALTAAGGARCRTETLYGAMGTPATPGDVESVVRRLAPLYGGLA